MSSARHGRRRSALFTGGVASPAPRTDADVSPRISMSSTRHGRRRYALFTGGGPHPHRELTLISRRGFPCPRLDMAAGAPRYSLAVWPHPHRELTLMSRLGFPCPRLDMAAGATRYSLAVGPTPTAN